MPDRNRNKYVLSKLGFALLILIVAGGMFTVKVTQSTDTKASLNAWEDVHKWRADGECADCHSKLDYVKNPVDVKHTLLIPAAKTHTENFRRFTHGKAADLASHNCQSCHEADTCKTCHSILPETHTSDFVEPTGNSVGSLRHSILAKTNPTSCNTCHDSFVESCTACHSAKEVAPWQSNAEKSLSRWKGILNDL